MSHPGPLLADYVDGTLDPSTRAEVDAHLQTCATCRGEVALAAGGAKAAQGLDEPAAPAGLGAAAVAEATRMAAERNPEVTQIAGRARRRPTTPRVLAAAGAAAVILLLVVVAPKLGQDATENAARPTAAGAQGATAYPQASTVEIQHADYTSAVMPDVVARFSSQLTTSAGAESGPVASSGLGASAPSGPPALNAQDVSKSAALLPKATACLETAFGRSTGTLSRVIRASFAGQPAYLGVYLIGPGADLPPTVLQLSVASVHGCQALSQTTARL
jgi:anti-sigma factor RsiW